MPVVTSEIKKEEAKTNPYGANQYLLDPRQKLCWDYYVDPKSETFGIAYASAIKAKYEEYTAKQITVATWFIEKTRRLNMLGKAERNLDEAMDMPTNIMKTSDEKEYVLTDPALVRIKVDVSKFVAERQGKKEGWSPRTEYTGEDGEPLFTLEQRIKRKNKQDAE